jgi:hypothetical protein
MAMFREKRLDTQIDSIEATYGIDLRSRGDALLGNLLEDRGFDSLTQLIKAYRGKLRFHPRRRRLFLSFHAEDRAQVQGFRLMGMNPNVDVEFYDASVRSPIASENARYVRSVIKEKIRRSSVLVCLIGDGTAWREWVNWEIDTALQLRKGICGVRLKGSRGRAPPVLARIGAPIAKWNAPDIVSVIECAAARRS